MALAYLCKNNFKRIQTPVMLILVHVLAYVVIVEDFFLSLILYDNITACTDLPEEESCEEHGVQSSSFSNGSNTVKIPSKLGI